MTSVDKFIRQHASWGAFFAAATKLPDKASGAAPDKGKVFERLTQLYLKTNPEYQTKLREVWIAHVDLPPKVRAKLNLPDDDEGIDLIAESFAGEFWAIQCKFRSDTSGALTVRELSTFTNLCFNVCRDVSLAVVAHTCSKPVRKHHLLGNTTEIGLQRWLEIDDEEWNRLQAATTRPAPPPTRRKPRDHQKAAIKAARTHFLKGNATRGKLLMPCGTGKSLTAFWIADALNAKSIVVAVPSLSLIKQSLLDWTREFLAYGEVPEWLCVCSDETTGNLDRDEFVSEVYELGVDATTDPEAIGRYLTTDNGKRKIVFTTYQSGRVLAEAAQRSGYGFDLGIMDEAHRTVGGKEKSFAHLVSDDNLPIARRIFMTATERITSGSNDEVLSMDDVATYGDCFYQLSFKQAIESDPPIISDYRILTITVSDAHVRELIAQNRYLTTPDKPMDEREAQSLAAGIALQRTFGEYGVRHAISFHRSIRAAQDFRTQHEQIVSTEAAKPVPVCYHVSSQKSTGERARLMQQFRDAPAALITNARCLQEGVDIPAVDCVLFADPKQSVVDIVQAAGRAMRPYLGKQFGYIVIPIVVPNDMDFDTFADTTEFRQVARVITALSTQDGRIAEEFRTVEGKPRKGGRIVEINGDVPVGYRIELEELRQKIRLKLWECVGRANWREFEAASTFAQGLGLHDKNEWSRWVQGAIAGRSPRPFDIPSTPERAYAGKGWTAWADWLGTSRRRTGWRSFADARTFVRSLKLGGDVEWRDYCAGKLASTKGLKPSDIPSNPNTVYRGSGYVDFGDWLGTGTVALGKKAFRPFDQAKEYVHALALRTVSEWHNFARSDKRPNDIPVNPDRIYAKQGWKGFGDWLGSVVTATRQKKYRSFVEARAFVQSLGLKQQSDWIKFCKSGHRPDDIPVHADRTYANQGWIGYSDWLGAGCIHPRFRVWRQFESAREYVRSLGLTSLKDWRGYCTSMQLPQDIPANPQKVYTNAGWRGYGDWLGTGAVAPRLRIYRDFSSAKTFCRSLRLHSQRDWATFCKSGKLPVDIPSDPRNVYKDDGWKGYGDWLGTRTVATWLREYRSFRSARAFVRSLGLESFKQWRELTRSGKLPLDIPANPHRTYKENGWLGYGDWLGTGAVAPRMRTFRNFKSARQFARSLDLRSSSEWQQYSKSGQLPLDIPKNPARTYAGSGWKGMGDWLGTGAIAPTQRQFRPFVKARRYVRALNLGSQNEWRAFTKSGKRPPDIPSNPNTAYREQGWVGFGNWLGTNRVANQLKQYRGFTKARAFARSLRLKSIREWRNFVASGKLPQDIPANPDQTYAKEGWAGFPDWLGKK